ncbi:hypothetical protein BpHYR1_043184 [Brachionus plicatilis]|uniref:Uncharacterized protein n=1 Tax=Brachionus plicatilis TaxID=10195 RepID=A0A3M7R9F8_BRAPC|nr:hypothetical protein BpHYR1_043184 [Brachionus plicatilis]
MRKRRCRSLGQQQPRYLIGMLKKCLIGKSEIEKRLEKLEKFNGTKSMRRDKVSPMSFISINYFLIEYVVFLITYYCYF